MIALALSLVAVLAVPFIHAPCDDLPFEKWLVCQDVALAARRVGVSERIATALAFAESGFDPSVISPRGAVGPLQVIPRWCCPDGQAEGCDLVMAGVLTLSTLLEQHGDERGICHYNSGNVCSPRALRYARHVLTLAERR